MHYAPKRADAIGKVHSLRGAKRLTSLIIIATRRGSGGAVGALLALAPSALRH